MRSQTVRNPAGFAVLGALLALASPVAAAMVLHAGPLALPATPQQDFRWSGVVRAGDRVEIKGVNGTIRAEAGTGNQVVVTAVKREGRRGRLADVRIETVPHGNGLTICAIYPSRRRANECTPGEDWETNVDNNDVAVDFVVRVPRGVHFMGKTVNGEVSARSLPADATVSSVNGNVTVDAAGVVEASTVNGSIRATTGSHDPGRALQFTTVNGGIILNVPSAFRARVRAEVLNGSISSDFPIDVEHGRYVGHSARGELGRDGHTLRLQTVNGSIQLRRSDA